MRALCWRLFKVILFKCDAERVHELSLRLIRWGMKWRGIPLRIVSGSPRQDVLVLERNKSRVTVFGIEFASPLGLAAGFDKNAEILEGLPDLGFGFAEIGTVTPLPQSGNERPRLFRDPGGLALFNRMGFNSQGAQQVALHLKETKRKLPPFFRVGVNVGKNKETPLARASEDYVKAVIPFEGLADYLVINVSSPNTPGLRLLQSTEALCPIVQGVLQEIKKWKFTPPLLLKLASELSEEELRNVIETAESWGIQGWILTNTLAGSFALSPGKTAALQGGWSGKPLQEISKRSLDNARRWTQKPIISVGGIVSKEEASARIAAGADLVQIYTGWVYQGPTFPVDLSRHLASQRGLLREHK